MIFYGVKCSITPLFNNAIQMIFYGVKCSMFTGVLDF